MSSNPTAKNCMWFKQECCALSSTTLVWTQAEVTMTSMGSRERCSKPHAIRTGITLHSCLNCMRFFAVWFEPTTKVSILGTGAFARVLVQILGISASLLLSYVFVFYVLKNRVSAYWCVCVFAPIHTCTIWQFQITWQVTPHYRQWNHSNCCDLCCRDFEKVPALLFASFNATCIDFWNWQCKSHWCAALKSCWSSVISKPHRCERGLRLAVIFHATSLLVLDY